MATDFRYLGFNRFVAVFPKYSSLADSPTYNQYSIAFNKRSYDYSTYKIDVID